jgi:hypothetical protein
MSEAKKITLGVLGGVLGIAALFALALLLAGKGDEPTPEPNLAQEPQQQVRPVPLKPAPTPAQSVPEPKSLPAEHLLTPPKTVQPPPRPVARTQPPRATGIPTYVGPRGGVSYYGKSAKKSYERSSGGDGRR